MTGNQKRGLIFGGIGLTGLVCLVAVCLGGVLTGGDPTDHVQDRYQRDVALDRPDGAVAYRATRSPSHVVSDLRDNTDEVDHRRTSNVHFLQYEDHIVAVRDHRTGAVIHVDDYRSGYRHYSSTYPGFAMFGWSSSPPQSGFFGGGSGFGK